MAVGGSGGARGAEGWALSCISLYLEDSIPQTEKQTDRQTDPVLPSSLAFKVPPWTSHLRHIMEP